MTGGRNDAHGMTQPLATWAQVPLQEITTTENYLGVGRRADDKDPGTAPIEMAVEVTKDA